MANNWPRIEHLIINYLEGRVPLAILEDEIADFSRNQPKPIWLTDLFHALQHHDIDIKQINSRDAKNIKVNFEQVLKAISSGNDDLVNRALTKLFSNPYGQQEQ